MPSTIVCADCGAEIDPVTDPSICPICDSGNRLIEARDEATITTYEQIGLKKRRPGKKQPYEEIKAGDDFHFKSGQWNRLERVIDRENDHYFEHIEDTNGNTIRHCDEPLSQHQGHGDAKRPSNPPVSDSP